MTSGTFDRVPIASITVNRAERQRRELTGIEELAASIRESGLINPPVVTRELVLVAGERRLTACRSLGFETIPVQYADDLDEVGLHLIELEENVRREELTWQDRTRAVAAYYDLRREQTTAAGEPWSKERAAEELAMSDRSLRDHLLVNRYLTEGVEGVSEAPQFSTAKNFAMRLRERQKASILREVVSGPAAAPAEAENPSSESSGPSASAESSAPAPKPEYAKVQQADFCEWSSTVLETPFNLIHCDFPYGIDAGNKVGLSARKSFGGYDDDRDVYFNLLATLIENQNNFIAPSAHMIFWFSMRYYTETVAALREAEWRVDPFPFIWHHSDNAGIVNDPKRGGRRTYDAALLCTRGDRYIVKPKANSFAASTSKRIHMSEKPLPVLHHLFEMYVDETTMLLDPTCGSGNAIKAGEEAGARFSLGLELDAEFARLAAQNVKGEL